MMTVKLITYDLNYENSNKTDYEGFYKYIKSQDYIKLSESSYAVYNSATPTQIRDILRPFIDTNDHIAVITLTRPYDGWHLKAVWDWLNARL